MLPAAPVSALPPIAMINTYSDESDDGTTYARNTNARLAYR